MGTAKTQIRLSGCPLCWFLVSWLFLFTGREIDAFARAPLWNAGLIYRHGTGHGIGMYLSVHEGPAYISKSTPSFKNVVLDEYQFLSDEPGYYEDGQFGIRLENIVMVKNATTTHKFPGTQFLTFEHVTLVPYEPNLIDYTLLNEDQINYLNDYHKMCREIVGPELQRQGKTAGYDWMMRKAKDVPLPGTRTSSAVQGAGVSVMLLYIFVSLIYLF